jgi:hypothetical protein
LATFSSSRPRGQSIHITKLRSAFHSAVNPINVIASFRNAGTTLRVGRNTLSTWYVGIDQCHCLPSSAEVSECSDGTRWRQAGPRRPSE